MLFNTLLLSICANFISIGGQSFVEIAIFWAQNRKDAVEWARWFQLARIAAFVNPFLNPLLVILRIPTMNEKLRWFGRYITNVTLLFCCRKRAKKRRTMQRRILISGARESPIKSHALHFDDLFFKVI
ncbi:hypothetical protein X798_06898 [Onchocerca flexuosa]|uniref:G_PROTEIN_RECEP_F1_2 domain-containing protein n=1 Tax=Onchocerca flexuosa TaxID=387005 RepID=A0A238BNI1_9BILA|nr:hypothetical protein X798_06898 [Onchocerca flexuosa]